MTILADEGQGGIHTAVEHFAAALRPWAEHAIVDFSALETPGAGDRTRLRISPGFLGRKFGWIDRAERRRGEAVLAGADFVLLHVPYRYHATWAARWCRDHGVPFAFVPHGAFDPYVFTYRAWQKRGWLRFAGKRVVQGAAFVLYATAGEAKKGQLAAGAHRQEILPWPNPVPASLDRSRSRATLGRRRAIPDDANILLYLGRLHPMKRPRETVEAFRAAAAAGWHLLVVGPDDGVTAAELRALAGDAANVHVAGPLFGAAKDEALAGADGLVLFSHRENFGFVVAEALARETPVVVSHELDLGSEIETHAAGVVGDGRSAEGRNEALRRFFAASPERRAAWGRAGRNWIATEMSETRFADRLRAMIVSETAKAKRP